MCWQSWGKGQGCVKGMSYDSGLRVITDGQGVVSDFGNWIQCGGIFVGTAVVGQACYNLASAAKVWGTIQIPHQKQEVKYDERLLVGGVV